MCIRDRLQAWGRVAKALGQDFIPYLNVVMPPLLKSVSIKADVEVVGEEEDPDDEDEDIATVIVQVRPLAPMMRMMMMMAMMVTMMMMMMMVVTTKHDALFRRDARRVRRLTQAARVEQTDTGTRKVALKTSALEEKATACTMLVCYFGELQVGAALNGRGV
eukprot:3411715-Rhodomonas_salina.1